MYYQGTTVCVKKLNVKTIGDLKIRLLKIEKQREIGELYRLTLIQNRLRIKLAEDMNNYALSMIRKLGED